MVTVKFFALFKERSGRAEIELAFSGRTASDLLGQIAIAYPSLAELITPGRVMISVNQEFVKADEAVKDGDEVALMPPFSGGSGLVGIVRIQKKPFLIDEEIELLKKSSSSIGGVVVFVGTTRDISRDKAVFQT